MKIFNIAAGYLFIYALLSSAGTFVATMFGASNPFALNIAVTVITTLVVSKLLGVQFGSNPRCLSICLTGGLAAGMHLWVLSQIPKGISLITPIEITASVAVNSIAVGLTLLFARGQLVKNHRSSR